jgi:drug/metabolite transporter (DMT)-like permease
MLVLVFALLGKRVSMLEWCGVLIVMLGIILSAYRKALQQYDIPDHRHRHISNDDESSSESDKKMWFGDFLCLLAAASEMVILLDRIKTKDHIPLFQVASKLNAWND